MDDLPFDAVTENNLRHIEAIAIACETTVDGLYEMGLQWAKSRDDFAEMELITHQWQRYHFLCRQRAQYFRRRSA